MSDGALVGLAVGIVTILASVILWTADRHAKSLEKFDARLSAHLKAEEQDMVQIREALTDIRSDAAETRVDVAFIAGRQGIDLPPR